MVRLKVNTYLTGFYTWLSQAGGVLPSSSRPDCRFLLRLGAQRVDMSHPQFEAVQEVFRQAVPVLRQTLPMLENGLHAEPRQREDGQKWALTFLNREVRTLPFIWYKWSYSPSCTLTWLVTWAERWRSITHCCVPVEKNKSLECVQNFSLMHKVCALLS